MKCPRCDTSAYLYKEIKDDGKCMIGCLHCHWETGELDHHIDIDVPTKKELKESWD